MYRFSSIKGNSQKLDGGAMFGHVPKNMWCKWFQPDEHNRITLACRALLIQEDNKNILLETGIGAFFNPALRERYGVIEAQHVLLEALHHHGLEDKDIDFIILSHLHFDHAGGLLSTWQQDQPPKLLFPKAKYLVSKPGWERALHPHMRDRASFIPALHELLINSNRLVIVDKEQNDLLGKNYRFVFTNGHTPGLMHTILHLPHHDGGIIFASDLIPGTAWTHLPVTMGYDRSPELLIDEKKQILELAIKQNSYLFYTHDPHVAMSRITQDSDGKFSSIDAIAEFSETNNFNIIKS